MLFIALASLLLCGSLLSYRLYPCADNVSTLLLDRVSSKVVYSSKTVMKIDRIVSQKVGPQEFRFEIEIEMNEKKARCIVDTEEVTGSNPVPPMFSVSFAALLRLK
jgi:hypothetical protein